MANLTDRTLFLEVVNANRITIAIMVRGSPEARIVGGLLLVLLDVYCLSLGRLPLKGRFEAIVVAEHPQMFWTYAVALGAIATAAILWGIRDLWRRRSKR